MGLQSCQILLDNEWGVYYTGQTITGRVELSVDSPKKVRGIQIVFKGEAHTQWSIEESKTNNQDMLEHEQVEFTGNEEYFKTEFYLIGGQGGEIEVPVGQHTYPFTCVLPPILPSSFEGEFGYVRYIIKVTLDRPWAFDQESKRAFTVLSPVDLNVNLRLKERAQVALEKYFCCCWCRSGPLTCVVTLPRTGYVPGQVIPVLAEIDNISNVEITGVDFALEKTVTYYSQFPRREVKKAPVVITEFKVGAVGPNASNTWNQSITVPPIPPSNLTNCSLIDVDYSLNVVVKVAGFHTNLESRIPITIGTIPLTDGPSAPVNSTVINMNPEVNLNDQQPLTDGNEIGWVANNQENGTANIYPALPSYAESQFKTKSIRDSSDNDYTMYWNNNMEYSPVYPVYNANSTQ